MPIVNNLIMELDGQNILVYPYTVGRAVYINESNGYNLIQALADLRNNATSEWNDVKNKPFSAIGTDFKVVDGQLRLNGSFSMEWSEIQNKPTVFNSSWGRITGKPTMYPSDWSMITNQPSIYNSDWESVANKPEIFPTNWNSVNEKPEYFDSEWFTMNNKPFNLIDGSDFYVNTNDHLNILQINNRRFARITDNFDNEIMEDNIPYILYNIQIDENHCPLETLNVPHLMGIRFVGRTDDVQNDIDYYVAKDLGVNAGYYLLIDNSIHNYSETYKLPANSSHFFNIINGFNLYSRGNNNYQERCGLLDFDFNYIENASYLFDQCNLNAYGMQGINFNKFSSLTIKNFSNLFYNCYDLYYPAEGFYLDFNNINYFNFTSDNFSNILYSDNSFLVNRIRFDNTSFTWYNNYNPQIYRLVSNNVYVSQILFDGNVNLDNVFLAISSSQSQLAWMNISHGTLQCKTINSGLKFPPIGEYNFYYSTIKMINAMCMPATYQGNGTIKINSSYYYDDNTGPNLSVITNWVPFSDTTFINVGTEGSGTLKNMLQMNMAITPGYNMFYNSNVVFNQTIKGLIVSEMNNNFRYFPLSAKQYNILGTNKFTILYNYNRKQYAINSNFNLPKNAMWTFGYPWSSYTKELTLIFENYPNIKRSDYDYGNTNFLNCFHNLNLYFLNCTFNQGNFDIRSYTSYMEDGLTPITTLVNINGDMESFASIRNLDLYGATAVQSVQVINIQQNFYGLNYIDMLEWGYGTAPWTRDVTIILPDETGYSRSSSSFASDSGLITTHNTYRKNFYIHGYTDLDQRWGNKEQVLKDFFNITDPNIIANCNQEFITGGNGYIYPDYNLYIYNNTKSTFSFIMGDNYLHLYPYNSNIKNIQVTNVLPPVEDTTNYIYFGNFTPYKPNVTNSYINLLENGGEILYLYINDADTANSTLHYPVSSKSDIFYDLITAVTEPFAAGDDIVNFMNNLSYIPGATYTGVEFFNAGKVTINNSVNFTNASALRYLYSGSSVKRIFIPETVTDMAGLYYNCIYLTGHGKSTSQIVNMNQAYMNCTNLTSGTIGPNVKDSGQAFYNCTNLTEFNMYNTSYLGFMAFYNCQKLNGAVHFDNFKGNVAPGPFFQSNIEEMYFTGTDIGEPYSIQQPCNSAWNLRYLEIGLQYITNNTISDLSSGGMPLYKLESIIINTSDYIEGSRNNGNAGCYMFASSSVYLPSILYTPVCNRTDMALSAGTPCNLAPNMVVGGFVGNFPANTSDVWYLLNMSQSNSVVMAIGNYFCMPYMSGDMSNIVIDSRPERFSNWYNANGVCTRNGLSDLVYGIVPFSLDNYVSISNQYFNVQYAYWGCNNLLLPTLNDDYENFLMCSVYYSFGSDMNLVLAVGPSGRHGYYRNIDSSYNYCPNLRIIVAGLNKEINISQSFWNCINIKSIYGQYNNIYSSFDNSINSNYLAINSKTIYYSFNNSKIDTLKIDCGNLQSSFYGGEYNNIVGNICNGWNSFQFINNLHYVDINIVENKERYSDWENINAIVNASCIFEHCPNLITGKINIIFNNINNCQVFCYDGDHRIFNDCNNMTTMNINLIAPEGYPELNNLYYNIMSRFGFNQKHLLTSLNLLSFPRYCEFLFYNDTNLAHINLLDNGTDQCVIVEHMFEDCFALQEPFIFNNVSSMNYTYSGCASLVNSVCGPNVIYMSHAYENCISLYNVNIGESVEDLTRAFAGCPHINNIIIVNSPNINLILQPFEYSENGYQFYVPSSSITNATFFEMGNDQSGHPIPYVFANTPSEIVYATWTLDPDNSCYYDAIHNIYVYYTL